MTSRLPNPFETADEPSTLGDDDPADAVIGRVIAGRYRVTSILGRGGMGVVYGGTHLELDREVAIKVLPGQFTRDSEVLKRFEREARTASKVPHRNIVTVYDFGRLESGEPYLVMEKLEGLDLEQVLAERGRLPPAEALAMLTQTAEALDAVHAQAVVHRDIKPSNVFFTKDGVVKVVDFGVAAFHAAGERLTRTGSVVGTAEYMAPEAARGSLVDARGDVYSLATLAFEVLTGRLPFVGMPVQVLIEKVSHEAPKLSEVSDLRFSDAIERTMARALAREPEGRPSTAGELDRELADAFAASPAPIEGRERAARGPRVPAVSGVATRTPPSSTDDARAIPRSSRAGVWIAALVIVLLLGGGGVWVSGVLGGQDLATSEPVDPAVVPTVVATTEPAVVPPEPAIVPPEPAIVPVEPTAIAPTAIEPVAAAPEETPTRTARRATTTVSDARAPVIEEPAPEPVRPVQPEPEATATREEPAPIESGPERAEALVREAQSALLRGEVPRARELYRDATGAAPRNGAAWRGLGLACERLDLRPEALRAYERYLAIAPNAGDADAIRARIQRLGGEAP